MLKSHEQAELFRMPISFFPLFAPLIKLLHEADPPQTGSDIFAYQDTGILEMQGYSLPNRIPASAEVNMPITSSLRENV